MQLHLKTLLASLALAAGAQAGAQVIFYTDNDFQGRSISTDKALDDFRRVGFNDRASSVIVLQDRWEVCDDAHFGGRCVVLRQGRYPNLGAIGLNDRISSVREVHRDARLDASRYAPAPPMPVYDSRRRGQERLFQADVSAVHAVVGPPTQRCWIEREQVSQTQSSGPNVGGALAGALIGGFLGHQIGGRGRDGATAGGAIVGAAVGANAGREDTTQLVDRDVQRCANTANPGKPEFWDVSYNFRGQEHHVQMTAPPGATITVNGQGEPRG